MSQAPIVDAVRGRALLVIHYPVFGGPHNQALRLEEPLRRAGWETTVLLPAEPGNAAEILEHAGLEVECIPLSRLRAPGSARAHVRLARDFPSDVARIRRVIRDRAVDLVIVAGLVNPHAAVAARREGVPVVWQILDTRAPQALRLASVVLVRRLADVVMTTGSTVAELHPGIAGLGDRVVHFFPPVDVDLFKPSVEGRLRARRELGLPTDGLVIGNVGVLSPMKRHLDFIRAASIVAKERTCRFVILGASYDYRRGYTEELLHEARSAGLEVGRDLIIRDPEGRVHELAPAFDVFWLTSAARSEGVPTAVGEAMALELPIVATDAGGTRDAVEDEVTGYVVPPGDPFALVRATQPLLDDPSLRERLGRAGRARAEQLFALEPVVQRHLEAFQLALTRRRRFTHVPRTAGNGPQETTTELLRCPRCHARLNEKASALHCLSCQSTYRIIDGIPVLLPSTGDTAAHKRQQAAFFDTAEAEFEIERPHGTARFYGWLIEEKFRRSVVTLRGLLVGATTLTVCGGSGMDAEFLASSGARVIASDLSLEAARRTRERARRHGVTIDPIVADVERLPFADRSVDVVFVHDGLHHLQNPIDGLREMARVARIAVSVNEPAYAAVTRAAIRYGLASHHEEAGNFIARLRLDDIVEELRRAGFEIRCGERYAMYYRHEPGPILRMLSLPVLRHTAMAAVRVFNTIAGRIGNKLTVQAMRSNELQGHSIPLV